MNFSVGEIFSVLASAGSAIATAYLWLVRMNAEKPRLRTHLVALEAVRAADTQDETWDPVIDLRLAVMNLSTLPNVVLAVRFSLRQSNGTWTDFPDVQLRAGSGAFNIGPKVAEFVSVTLSPYRQPKLDLTEEELARLSWHQMLERTLGGAVEVKVEVTALDDKTFADVIRLPAAG